MTLRGFAPHDDGEPFVHQAGLKLPEGWSSANRTIVDGIENIEAARSANALITECVVWRGQDSAGAGTRDVQVSFVAKDMFDTAGIRTTYGSAAFEENIPYRNAAVIEGLLQKGCVLIGKANQHEFAWGVTSQNIRWGDVKNPTDPGLTPGGSSGGNAAALAVGYGTFGLGTDTAGSVRIPAACCSVVGFRPLLGTIPIEGCFALSPSFDVVGPMARNVVDCVLAHELITGSHVTPRPNLNGLRVGVLSGGPFVRAFEQMGARVVDVTLPFDWDAFGVLQSYESAETHRQVLQNRQHFYSAELLDKIRVGQSIPYSEAIRAGAALKAARQLLRGRQEWDLLIGPTLGVPVPPADCSEPEVRAELRRLTAPYNGLNLAALAIGNVQIAGWDNQSVLQAGLAFEAFTTKSSGPPAGDRSTTPPPPKE